MHPGAQNYLVFDTAMGFCGIGWNAVGVTRFLLPAHDAQATERALQRRTPGAAAGLPPPRIIATIAAARLYFEGQRIDFSDVTLDLGGQDPFFQEIYTAARRIAWGETTTYGALAKALGAGPEAARDVGQAMAKNPAALIIPCHRVLAAGNKPGGFSAPGGTSSKLRMLALEGVRLDAPASLQHAFAF
ncbi:MAG TPA: methylated-DNA--[protein]-cysteine S-methyltransferase [Beijerinckiaceae bacterium]|jgi:methylated-DNA-[protein]-cysteine S-methyltransferase|nr:methylated-DNA--[protein]-cysteine S-methyltransferase [Beijerinckiaceae bacterium]